VSEEVVRESNKKRILPGQDLSDIFNGVVMLSALSSPKDPILIFKTYCAPFYQEIKDAFGNPWDLNNYCVYWKGKLLFHELPQEAIDTFKELECYLYDCLPSYLIDWPNGCKEFRINDLIDGHFEKYNHYAHLKEVLRKLKFHRIIRKEAKEKLEYAKIAWESVGSPKEKPYPIKELQAAYVEIIEKSMQLARHRTPA